MNIQDEALDESAVDTQHQTIMEGGKIEEFADALGRFCRVEGWKKLKDDKGEPFRSLRHYVEAPAPFGAGYSGKAGMDKIEAYLSLNPRIKDYFQHCHANCLSEMAKEQGVSPTIVSKNEFDDTKGARLAKSIADNPEEIYLTKAAAYIEDKERVKPSPKFVNEYAPIRMSYRPTHTYSFAKKLKDNTSAEDLALLIEALNSTELDELIEFEKYYNIALSAFNRTKSDKGWGPSELKAPEEHEDKSPKVQLSKWLDTEEGADSQLSLRDETGDIVVVEMSRTGTVKGLTFN